MRVAVLDLGSNTSLLLVADVEGQVLRRVVHDETMITRMGQGVHANRAFHPEALQRLDQCLGHYARKIHELRCQKVVAVATSAARDVQNGEALLELGRRHGIPIHIISGEREAALTFHGALCDRATTMGLAVIDVGGGSTELIVDQGNKVSVDVGSVRLTELLVRGDPIQPDELVRLREFTREAFSKVQIKSGSIRELVAVGGTPTTIAAIDQQIEFNEEKIHGYKLTIELLEGWILRLARLPLEERQALSGMQPKRADVIVAGSMILSEGMRRFNKTEVTVSTRGVRYGVALNWQGF